ncbi:DPP IV N-terminal domain-containing protein [Lysobacter enzymogenes]|uniref:DPP IV N-terminal domain-containing protein n=1 Tax=Lysobacter enzymogenes TaxID=69 RepID=UPI001AF946F7|nr:DPP IV N-terminal domain-containing protein [Lysobacter enzymogenes]QQQ01087.1 hypothetical protein JHW41_24020 [Lysobacter enzymogenes]
MKGILAPLSLLAMSIVSSPVFAQDATAYPCFQCSDAEMVGVAKSYGSGTRYIYSLMDRIAGFNVQGNSVTSFPPDQFVQDQFWALSNLYIESNGSMIISIVLTIPESEAGLASPVVARSVAAKDRVVAMAGDGTVNAYDVLRSSQARNLVDQKLKENPKMAFTAAASSMGRAIKFEHLTSGNAKLSTEVKFPDGSRVVFVFNYDTKIWEYAKGTAVDSNNNSIPDVATDFAGGDVGYAEFGFSSGFGSDVTDFIHRANMMGIPVTGQRGSGKTGIACTKVGSSIRCQLVSL